MRPAPGARAPRPDEALDAALRACPAHSAAVIGPLARALLPLLRPPADAPRPGPGAPDGLDGWSRRGPWHRLAPSEWALLDVLPDELLRRAADGELPFLALKQAAPAAPRGPVALLDAGPAALGLPRIGQAAALAARAAHCAALGQPLRWGALQADPAADGWLAEGLGPGWLARLWAMRAPRPADGAALAAARDRVAALGLGPPLLLGGEGAGAAWPGAEALELAPVDDGAGAGLLLRRGGAPLLRWTAPAGAPDALRPAPAAVGRRAPALDGPVDLRPGFFFSPSGARLLGLTAAGEAVAIAIPDDGAPPSALARRAPVAPVRALGWVGQRLGLLCQDPATGAITVDLYGALRTGPAPEGLRLRGGPPGLLVAAEDGGGALVLPAPGAEISLRWAPGGAEATGWPAVFPGGPGGERPAIAVAGAPLLRPLAGGSHPGGAAGRPWGLTKGRARVSLVWEGAAAAELRLAGVGLGVVLCDDRRRGRPPARAEGAARLWTTCVGPAPRAWAAERSTALDAEGARSWVIGGLRLPEASCALWGMLPGERHPLAVVEEAGALSLRWFGAHRELGARGPLRWAAPSPRGDALALLDADGALTLLDPRSGAVRLRLPAGAP